MSFKIFSLQLLGKIKPVEVIEQKRKNLSDDFKEFLEVESSDELKKYLEIESRVNAGEFKKKKAEIDALQFKGSKEESQLKEFIKLKKSKAIKNYFKVAGSAELKRFESLKSEKKLDEYRKLQEFLNSGNHSKDDDFKTKKNRYKQLKSDSDVKFYLKYEKSSLYKNYLNVVDSSDLKRYKELEEITASEEYQQRKAYLEDKKKWEKTGEYAQLQEFEQMKKLPHLVKYFKYKGSDAFRFFTEWDVTFEDHFSQPKLDAEKWETTGFLANKLVGDNYSLAGDLNAYTNGDNIKAGQKLSIEIKKEKKTGKVWNPAAGFVPMELDYTSGIVSSWNSFWQEDGIFEAKIKYNPVKQVVNSFFLSGEQNMPRVNLLEMGTKNRVGISTLNTSGKAEVNGADISNLKKDKWYIFTVEKQGRNFTWKINETEIFAADTSELDSKLHLNASGMVVDEIPSAQLPASFDIEWVKCYRKK